jgi:hypothetical protein
VYVDDGNSAGRERCSMALTENGGQVRIVRFVRSCWLALDFGK